MNNIRSFLYRNAEHADDVADLDLGTDPTEVLKGAYSVWNHQRNEFYKENRASADGDDELFYNEACKLVRPYKGLFKGTITGNDFLFIGEGVLAAEGYVPDEERAGYGCQYSSGFGCSTTTSTEFTSCAGLFLSALLNETDLERMTVDWYPAQLWGLGYRLKDGKEIVVGPEARLGELGEKAEGGVTLVYGDVMRWLAKKASGGLHMNMGKRSRHTSGEWDVDIGEKSSGGIFINFGVYGDMGKEAANGTFIQLGKSGTITSVGDKAIGAVCVGVHDPAYTCHYASHNVSEYEAEYGKDEVLKGLLNELRRERPSFYAEEKPDILKIKDVARKVDAHVRENYPRRV